MTTDPILTVEEVAAELRLAESTMYSWRHSTRRGKPMGPVSFTVGARVVYRRSAVDTYLAEQEAASAQVAS